MTGIGHVAATSMVRGRPLLRITWGFVSHYVMDVFVAEYPSYPPTKKHLPWFLYQGVGIALFCAITGDWWAILYGMLWDVLEWVLWLFKHLRGERWQPLFWFHYYKNMLFKRQWGLVPTVALEAILVLLVFLRG